MVAKFRVTVLLSLFVLHLEIFSWSVDAMICKCNQIYQTSRTEFRQLAQENVDFLESDEVGGLAMGMSDCDEKNECEVKKIFNSFQKFFSFGSNFLFDLKKIFIRLNSVSH